MNVRTKWKLAAQLTAVVGAAALIKLYYSSASVNELRWILAPTTALVELISGTSFAFESHAGYMSSDHTFLIAASCAGVNFLLTAFLMLSLRKLWRDRGKQIPWRFFAAMAVLAYLATLVANTVRISSSLLLRGVTLEFGLTANQLHRFEGIFIYFGCLLLLFVISERFGTDSKTTISGADHSGLFRRSLFPLMLYYAVTLGIPFANGAYSQGNAFLEHSLFVILTSLLMMLPIMMLQFYRQREHARHRPRKVYADLSATADGTDLTGTASRVSLGVAFPTAGYWARKMSLESRVAFLSGLLGLKDEPWS